MVPLLFVLVRFSLVVPRVHIPTAFLVIVSLMACLAFMSWRVSSAEKWMPEVDG